MIIIGVDIETANLHGAICEFSAVGLDLDTGAELFVVTSLVDPGDVDWDPFAMRVHGIHPREVRGKPAIHAVWDLFLTELEYQDAKTGRPRRIFAHNASFERSQLTRALGDRMQVEFECTVRMARRGLREFVPRNHKLPTVCEVLGIPFRETHRAEADARAAAEIARRLVGMGVDVEVGAKVTAAPATPRPTRCPPTPRRARSSASPSGGDRGTSLPPRD
jgi:DNA polymerase-3 subunit epsilon